MSKKLTIADCDEMIARDPNDAIAYLSRGRLKQELGDLDGALADLDRAIHLSSEGYIYYLLRGTVRYHKKDYDGMLADLDEVIAREPTEADLLTTHALKALRKKQVDTALAEFNQALKISEIMAERHEADGGRKQTEGDLDGAIDDFDKLIAMASSKAQIYSGRAAARIEKRDWKGATADLDKSIELQPDQAPLYLLRGSARFSLGEYLAAFEDFDRAIRLQPGDGQAFSVRGMYRQKQGDFPGALADFEKAVAIDPFQADFAKKRDEVKALTVRLRGFDPAENREPAARPPAGSPGTLTDADLRKKNLSELILTLEAKARLTVGATAVALLGVMLVARYAILPWAAPIAVSMCKSFWSAVNAGGKLGLSDLELAQASLGLAALGCTLLLPTFWVQAWNDGVTRWSRNKGWLSFADPTLLPQGSANALENLLLLNGALPGFVRLWLRIKSDRGAYYFDLRTGWLWLLHASINLASNWWFPWLLFDRETIVRALS